MDPVVHDVFLEKEDGELHLRPDSRKHIYIDITQIKLYNVVYRGWAIIKMDDSGAWKIETCRLSRGGTDDSSHSADMRMKEIIRSVVAHFLVSCPEMLIEGEIHSVLDDIERNKKDIDAAEKGLVTLKQSLAHREQLVEMLRKLLPSPSVADPIG